MPTLLATFLSLGSLIKSILNSYNKKEFFRILSRYLDAFLFANNIYIFLIKICRQKYGNILYLFPSNSVEFFNSYNNQMQNVQNIARHVLPQTILP